MSHRYLKNTGSYRVRLVRRSLGGGEVSSAEISLPGANKFRWGQRAPQPSDQSSQFITAVSDNFDRGTPAKSESLSRNEKLRSSLPVRWIEIAALMLWGTLFFSPALTKSASRPTNKLMPFSSV